VIDSYFAIGGDTRSRNLHRWYEKLSNTADQSNCTILAYSDFYL